MAIEARLAEVLLANTAVSTLAGDRVFPVAVRSEQDFPALTYRRLAGERNYSLAGRGGWASVLVAIAGWAREYSQARALAEAVRQALDAYGDEEPDGIQVAAVADGEDTYEPDLAVFGCSLNVTLKYLEG